ncbi:MAG: hypothetical protein HY904_18290, partial [Deltaproteobacteria bacterium]|nr:hypothetical protein [Deltaproteobacteria bacterium]
MVTGIVFTVVVRLQVSPPVQRGPPLNCQRYCVTRGKSGMHPPVTVAVNVPACARVNVVPDTSTWQRAATLNGTTASSTAPFITRIIHPPAASSMHRCVSSANTTTPSCPHWVATTVPASLVTVKHRP